jgi:hypothetical protein
MRNILIITLVILTLIPSQSSAQKSIDFGFEQNVYPAGIISGLVVESRLGDHGAINFRIAANIARRKGFSGLNDDERGWGPGASIGYRYYLKQGQSGFFAGLRSDIWFMRIDWIDKSEKVPNGVTNITVIQPTLELGYMFALKGGWNLSAALTNGLEINVVTKGQEVGQGFITQGALRITRTLNI